MIFDKRGRGLLLLALAAVTGCSSQMYAEQARVYTAAVTDELVKSGACASIDACRQSQMVLWEGGGWQIGPLHGGGVDLAVYKVTDARVADALANRVRQMHAASPDISVSLVIQSNAHIDNRHPGTRVVVKRVQFPAADR